MRNETIDCVLISYHRPLFTWRCLEALKEYTRHPHRVIVVDNGSNEETLDMLWDCYEQELIDSLILLDTNRGLEPAKNIGLAAVQSEFYIDSDNDIIVPPPEQDGCWLEQLINLQEMNPEFAAIALTPQVFIGANKAEMFKDAPPVLERGFVGGSMRLMNTQAVREVGGWRNKPKDMIEANRGEEKYICGKLKEKGHKVGYARDIECFHMFGDDNWGYGEDIKHYHRDQWPIPSDHLYGSYEDWKDRKSLGKL